MPNESFGQSQHRLRLQVDATEQLRKEFLTLVWSERPISPEILQERFERLSNALDQAGGLTAVSVMHLFCILEQKATDEIRKAVEFAQSFDLNDFREKHPEIPALLIENKASIHLYAYKTMQSAQARAAGAKKRFPHRKKQIVINLLQSQLDDGSFVPGKRGDKAKFIRLVMEKVPEIEREATIHEWIKEHLAGCFPD
ncbi:MAG TPA: hypothetical protein VLF09_01200 [Cellvibrio sp.]|nr:hypothetical protein [Cellvibrio sp.]